MFLDILALLAITSGAVIAAFWLLAFEQTF